VNEVRQEPGGFMCLCEDTLSRDENVRPINVRRLLALVRRLVQLEGSQYVFEPNDPTFRRAVERGFTEVMGLLYALGALVGRTPEEAFRVNVSSPPNTRQSVDTGRLIVELKLAPSRPLAFLLVRLINRAERGFELETP
jgi:phage tail sheath protein FI